MIIMSRTIRLFVSSTFADLKAERDVLQEKVYPRLKQLCLAKGFRFQAIDLRWGISEEAGLDNRTMRICLRELNRCQQNQLKPNFLILLGDRYGWRPLPEILLAEVFDQLRAYIAQTDKVALQLLDNWYRRDDNAVPAVYELQPRKKAPYNNYDFWQSNVQIPLLEALEKASSQLWLDPEQKSIAIGISATEQEIIEGALQVPDAAEHVHAFFRTIQDMLQSPLPADYIDLQSDNKQDTDATEKLDKLKQKIQNRVGEQNVHRYTVLWRDNGISKEDLANFSEEVYCALESIILQQIAGLTEISSQEQEDQAHRAFGEERCRGFVGRAHPLQQIADYIDHGDAKPMAVIGASGSGKSALIAEAARRTRKMHPEAAVIERYIGVTPTSSDIIHLLRDIVMEIRQQFPRPLSERKEAKEEELPFEFNPLIKVFQENLRQASSSTKLLYIFLDALDQLSSDNSAQHLYWLPLSLPENIRFIISAALPQHCKIAGSTVPDPRAEVILAMERRISLEDRITLDPLAREDGLLLLDQWLAEAGRTLQPVQREAILEAFAAEGSPLWLKAAAGEAQRLHSWELPLSFPTNIQRLIDHVLDHLSQEEEHGALLVERALGYIACARRGLAEDEVIEVLSGDKEVMAEFRDRFPKSPRVDILPTAVWVRLYGDIAFYLRACEEITWKINYAFN